MRSSATMRNETHTSSKSQVTLRALTRSPCPVRRTLYIPNRDRSSGCDFGEGFGLGRVLRCGAVRLSRTHLRSIFRVVAICVVAVGVVWMVRGIDLDALGRVVRGARWWPIGVAAVINFGLIACKAIAWRLLLGPAYPVPLRRLFDYTVTSCAASVILPLRGGELIRLWLLRDREGVPIAHSAAVALTEKLLDIVSMLILVSPLPWLVDGLPPSLARWIVALSLGVLVILVVVVLVAPRISGASWVGRMFAGVGVIRRPRVFVGAVAALLVGWLIDLAMIGLVLWAVGIEAPVAAWVVVLFAINVTIAIPSTPGQLGALELGAMLGLHLVGVPEDESLAFALAYHVLQVIPVALVGLALHGRWLVSGTAASR